MKHQRSITDIYIKRDREILPLLFHKAKTIAKYPTSMKALCQIVAQLETPFYCISDDAALDYVRKRKLHGIRKTYATKYKQQLFDSLYEEVKRMSCYGKYAGKSLQDITLAALGKSAPCIGLTPWIIQFKLSRLLNRKSNRK